MRMYARNVVVGAVATASFIGCVNADEVTIGTSKDNTLFEDELGLISNGAGEYFFAGRTLGGVLRRGLIAFDVQSAVSAGSTITNVSLNLHMSRTIASSVPVGLHRAMKDWGEGASDAIGQEGAGASVEPGDATWLNTFFNTGTWDTMGGDFAPSASATTNVGGIGSWTWSSIGMIGDVQAWLDSGEQWGWVVLAAEVGTSAKRFDTKENPTEAFRPQLTITFEAGCPGDWNMDGVLNSADLFDFLADFSAGDADFNGDGVTNSSDFFLFLEAFDAGC